MHSDSLRKACVDLARVTMWDLRPVDTDRIRALADRFFELAGKRIELMSAAEDRAVVVRAVNFLCATHAIPPMKDDTAWFEQALDLLLQLVFPDTALDADARAFLKDVEAGIARARAIGEPS